MLLLPNCEDVGSLLFEIRSNKWRVIINAVISLAVGISLGLYCVVYWNSMVTWLAIVLVLITLLCVWYTFNRLSVAKHNKLSFYEKGMVIQDGRTVTQLLLADIKTYKTVTKERIVANDFVITFITHDDKMIRLDSDDYANLAHSLAQYGDRVNFEIRTSF
jgi:hypothetical protein